MISREQIQKLIQDSEEYFYTKNSLDYEIRQIIREYLKIEQDRDNLGNTYITEWHIDENLNNIEGRWEETWRYGGYDSGTFNIPLLFFYNESKLEEFRQQREKAKADREITLKENTVREEKAKLQKLAEKYNLQLVDKSCIS